MRHFTLFLLLIVTSALMGAEEDTTTLAQAPASKMPLEAQVQIDREAKAEKALQDKLALDIAKLHADLLVKMKHSQEAALHRSDLEGAEAIKAEIAVLTPAKVEAPVELDLTEALTGTFMVHFLSGRSVELTVTGATASESSSGNEGSVKVVNNVATVSWSNGSQWVISSVNGKMQLQASDGKATLTHE